MFTIGQRTAVAGAFKLAGYDGALRVAPITSEDERFFLLDAEAIGSLRNKGVLEQVVGQLLGCKVGIQEQAATWPRPIPFE